MKNKTIAFTTLGCKVNSYDTEAMAELFKKEGYNIVDFENFADIYLINTCTVTNFGDKKSRQMIRRAKAKNANAIIVAAGCYSQVAPEEVAKIEGINIVIGNKDRKKIVQIVENYKDEKEVLNKVSDIMQEKTFEPLEINEIKDKTRAYLKIQEGCNRFCTYCIIPFARGPVRSRDPKDVLNEVKRLVKNGFKEIILTGIHIISYGVDIGKIKLIDIIKQIHEVDGLERIRLSSVEPLLITDDFIHEIKKLHKFCDHYHLSLQSGCNKTLKNMKRHYTKEQYETAVFKLREAFPDVSITTDMIVGFPGETEEDFIESCEFVKKVKISQIHAFPFSPKKGTKAATFEEQVTNEVKAKRNQHLIEISKKLSTEFLEKFIGNEILVLFEREIAPNTFEGHTTNYIKVIVNSSQKIQNCIINVKIDKIINHESVFGHII